VVRTLIAGRADVSRSNNVRYSRIVESTHLRHQPRGSFVHRIVVVL